MPLNENQIVIGTAGHVDHGKTSLLKVLTDRLKEEQERGMSIELGFAFLDLPSGILAGIIDVPGHERFIKNMLAGSGGIDLVMMVIAADEGVMPQTREHLDILELLGIERGLVVLTKTDLVDPEWLTVVTDDVRGQLAGTFLANAEIVPFSAATGEGATDVVAAIDRVAGLAPRRPVDAIFRYPIDRVFTMSGAGTVVTGTLVSGTVRIGDTVHVLPKGVETRVRKLHVHGEPREVAYAGQRVAINLAGIGREDIVRGDVLAAPGYFSPSRFLEGRLAMLKSAPKPLVNGQRIRFYTSASEVLGHVLLLDCDQVAPGQEALAQFRLSEPVIADKGDRYVIRTYSPMRTIGGGIILDPKPPKHRRFDEGAIEALLTREMGGLVDTVLDHLQRAGYQVVEVGELARNLNTRVEDVLQALDEAPDLVWLERDALCVSAENWERLREGIVAELEAFHQREPLKRALPKSNLRRLGKLEVDPKLLDRALASLESEGTVRMAGPEVALTSHQVRMSPKQQQAADTLLEIFVEDGLAAPNVRDALDMTGADTETAKAAFQALVQRGDLVRLNEEVAVHRDVYEESIAKILAAIREHGGIGIGAEHEPQIRAPAHGAPGLHRPDPPHRRRKGVGSQS